MKILLTTLFMLLLLSSCAVRVHHQYFNNCNDGKGTELDQHLRLNGYYYRKDDQNNMQKILFYADGSYINEPTRYISSPDGKRVTDQPDDYGQYRLCNDTIKVQYFISLLKPPMEMEEAWYLIRNDSTVSLLVGTCRSCGMTMAEARNRMMSTDNNSLTFHFAPLAEKPDSVSWLRKEKWYWCK